MKRVSIESIINSIEPSISIDNPTAKKVKAKRMGFRVLDLIVSPIVVGSLEVNCWIVLDDNLTSACPLRTFKGSKLAACHAGLIPENITRSIVIIEISKTCINE